MYALSEDLAMPEKSLFGTETEVAIYRSELGAGGILQDEHENMKFAFSADLGRGTNTQLELPALLMGLRKCRALGVDNIILELDSFLVINWLKDGKCRLWYLEDFWEEISGILSRINFRFQHVFREGNKAIDCLVRMRSSGCNEEWFSLEDIPISLKGILRTDRSGLTYLRKSKKVG
ncbi:uncharacterized protein LOC118344003 [Juglans regia]|uniref:Uncharacterized protein LOC118344003 n=1 Tax=Juglans regia TaxID=51240 RepID=A0A6P9E5T6_JUGRE|nr:uncharacterized protein LOC118344003 [Juglans regia]